MTLRSIRQIPTEARVSGGQGETSVHGHPFQETDHAKENQEPKAHFMLPLAPCSEQ